MSEPTYKISASLLNSWDYHKKNMTERSLESFMNVLNGVFKDNKWTLRGHRFEKEVVEGKHGKLSQIVEGLPQQRWANKRIKVDDLNIKISGKTDAIDKDKKRIYDIKRVDKFAEDKYDDSMQHILYFYIHPDITDFYYLVVAGETDEDTSVHIVHKVRPSEEELDKIVKDKIKEFFDYLKYENLWETYLEKQKAVKR